MTNNQILVQDIETFATITRLTVAVDEGETVTDRVDQYFSKNTRWGIVSLDDDADGEYMAVLLVAAAEGPDYDAVTLDPVPSADAELEAKLDIMMEIDMNDASQDVILAALAGTIDPKALLEEAEQDAQAGCFAASVEKKMIARDIKKATITQKPRKQRKSKTPKTNTLNKGKTMKNHEILAAFISANPGVTRAVVFSDAGLQGSLRSPAQVTAIAAGDKMETKRWNSCINRFIRKIRRDGTDIQVVGQGKTATYTIGSPDGQLVLPFDEAADAHNAAIIGDESAEVVEAPKVDAKRAEEAPNQNLSFESLLAQLDEDEATITSDDQEAFEAAQKMIK